MGRGARINFLRKFLLGGENWKFGVVNLAVLVCVLRATTKKGHQLFEEKSAALRENPGHAYELPLL